MELNDSFIYRTDSKGQYDTNLNILKPGNVFPSNEVRGRNRVYRYCKKLYSGEYAKNKKIIALVDNKETEIPYRVLSINQFKLIVNKMFSLMFQNEISIKTGDLERDKTVASLVERTNWVNSIGRAVKMTETLGDAFLKTYINGVSPVSPLNCFKVVHPSDINTTLAFVLYEYLTNEEETKYTHMRVEIHTKGFIHEKVFHYSGDGKSGVLGEPVDYEYRGRVISKDWTVTETDIEDACCIQHLGVDIEADGVYGTSPLLDIQNIVFMLEARVSSEYHVIANHENPLLIMGQEMFMPDEKTGGYRLREVNGKFIVKNAGDNSKPEYVTWDGKLSNSSELREDLMDYLYELSEMCKPFMTGEYTGNISEETLNNTIKSAIDKANRHLTEMWSAIRESLYVLCRLNDIDISIQEINIDFNVGRTDDDKAVSEIAETYIKNNILSIGTILERYHGYTSAQARAEIDKILAEKRLLNGLEKEEESYETN